MAFKETYRQPRQGGFKETLTDITQGVALGMAEDPLVGRMVEEFVGWFPEFQGEDVKAKLREKLHGSSAGAAGEGAGELLALLGPGMGAFGLTRAALRGMVRKYGVGEAAQFLRQGESLASVSGKGFASAPMSLRLGEAAAGSVGLGAEGGARAAAEGEDLQGILTRAGMQAGLAAAGEGVFIGASKVPGVRNLLGMSRGSPDDAINGVNPQVGLTKERLEQELGLAAAKIAKRAIGQNKAGKAMRGGGSPAQSPYELMSMFSGDNPVKAIARDAKRLGDVRTKLMNLDPAEWRLNALKYFRGIESDLSKIEIDPGSGEKLQVLRAAEQELTMEAASRETAKKGFKRISKKISKNRAEQQFIEGNVARAKSNLTLLRGSPEEGIEGIIPALENGRGLQEYRSSVSRSRSVPPVDKASEGLEHLQGLMYGGAAFDGAGINKMVNHFLDRVAKSPETVLRELGTTGVVALDLARVAAMEARQGSDKLNIALIKKFRNLANAMNGPENTSGFKGPRISKYEEFSNKGGGMFAARIVDVYTNPKLAGMASVRKTFGDKVGDAWESIMGDIHKEYDALAAIGQVPKRLAANKYADQEVSNFFPQWWKPGSEKHKLLALKRLEKRYRAGGMDQTTAEMSAANLLGRMERNAKDGVKSAGNVDFQTLLPGDVRTKLNEGFAMVEDPLEVLRGFYSAATHRKSYGKFFGFDSIKGEDAVQGGLVQQLINGAVKEGVDAGRMTHIINLVAGQSHHKASHMKLARAVGNIEIVSKLGLAVLPNLSQGINDIAANGFKNYIRGFRDLMTKEGRDGVARGLGLADYARQNLRHSIVDDFNGVAGIVGEVPFDKMAKGYLMYTGFSIAEMANRTIGTSVALATFRDTIKKIHGGKLRGHAYARAERRMASMGVDLRDLQRKDFYLGSPKAYQALENKVAFRGSQLTQFIPDPTRIPAWAQTPGGRVMFQFKSFAFNQAKFLRENVLKEAVEGNMKPLAYFLTIYPMAGAAVREGVNTFRDNPKQRTGLWNYVDAMSTVGGWGLLESTLKGLWYNDAAGVLLGPFYGDMLSLAETAVQPDRFKEIEDGVMKSPFYRQARGLFRGVGGGAGFVADSAGTVFKYLDSEPVGDEEEDSVSTEELLRRRVMRRREGGE